MERKNYNTTLIFLMTTTESYILKNTNPTNPLLVSENIKPNQELIDDCFYIEEKKWGTWDSTHTDGRKLITSLTRENCIAATRFYLKGLQEGFEEVKSHEGTVGGKL
jgi:hypothetical protein